MKKIVIAGGSGFLGSRLSDYFINRNYQVFILTRSPERGLSNPRYVHWDGQNPGPWEKVLEEAFALINLAGRSVDCRYNQKNRREILASRLKSTEALGNAVRKCTNPPRVWVNSSSATIYRHSIDKEMTEDSGEFGTGFSVEVCQQWERMFETFDVRGVRNVICRTAIVIGRNSPVLKPFIKLVKFGLGGKQGDGNQFFSWIHEEDFCLIMDKMINDNKMNGVYNASSPFPVTNAELMRCFRSQLRMPFGIVLNKPLLEIGAALIRTETELVLKSRRVVPARLLEEGHRFKFTDLKSAFADIFSTRNSDLKL